MAKLTQDMKDIFARAKTFIMATADKDGKPNGVPIGLTRLISDDEIILTDCFMAKSGQNIEENPIVAVTYWSTEDHYGYQVKGRARIETSGEIFDDTVQWLIGKRSEFTAKAVVIVKVDEVYYIGSYKDSSVNLV